MKIHIQGWVIMLVLLAGIRVSRAGNVVWINARGGNWSDGANNWDAQRAPDISDIAIITNAGNYTITLDVSTTIAGFILGATDGGSTQIFQLTGSPSR